MTFKLGHGPAEPVWLVNAEGVASGAAAPVYTATKLVDNTGATFGINRVGNSPHVVDHEWLYDVARGIVPGASSWAKIGYNPDIDNARETMWPLGTRYAWPAAGVQMAVVSTSANDAGAGTGVRGVRIGYLTPTFQQGWEIVVLNGVGAVNTTATNIYRVNSVRATIVGTGGVAAGNISVTNAGTTYGYILAGQTRQRGAYYTVPAGNVLNICKVAACSATGTGTPQWTIFTVYATVDQFLGTVNYMSMQMEMIVEEATVICDVSLPLRYAAGTDIEMTALGQGGASNLVCECGLFGWLESA